LVVSQPDCSRITGAGSNYDLGHLIGYELTFADGPNIYKTTICQNPYPFCGECGEAGWCRESGAEKTCIGRFSLVVPFESGLELVYDGGDWGQTGSMVLTCDPNIDDLDALETFNTYTRITAKTKWACPSASSSVFSVMSPGTAICIVIVVLAVVYFVAGVAYNYFRLEKSGYDLIPNKSFWEGLPALTKDGVTFAVHKVSELFGKQS